MIISHQTLEGIALGSRTAALGKSSHSPLLRTALHDLVDGPQSPDENTAAMARNPRAGCFALITAVGMAIRIGVLKMLNGSNSSTIIVIGDTEHALPVDILTFVTLVDMSL